MTWTKDSVTVGDYETEEQAAQAFDSAVNKDHWIIKREVKGRLNTPNLFSSGSNDLRIDRVLVPTEALYKMGWLNGPVGVEIKKSKVSIGEPISQIRDYTNCAFQIRMESGPHYTVLKNIFLFPAIHPSGPVLSILTGARIGFASIGLYYCHNEQIFKRTSKGDNLSFFLAGQRVYCSTDGPRVESARRSGEKQGGR